ncbi:DMT family transporter [Bacillaceae bacterium]
MNVKEEFRAGCQERSVLAAKRRWILADLCLLGIAIGWGYTFVLTKDLLNEMTPLYFTGTRFLLAGIIIWTFTWKTVKKTQARHWKAGIICGLSLCCAFTLQIYGIEGTTPGKAGMITGTAVIIVPFLYFLTAGIPVQKVPLIGSFLAFFGLCLLSATDDGWTGFNPGDLLVLASAFFFAVHVVLVNRMYAANDETFSPVTFAMIQLLVVGVTDCSLAVMFEPLPQNLTPYGWFAYSFDLFIGTLLAYLVQIWVQAYSPPTHVSLILSLESVFAFLFSWMLWGEPLTVQIALGILAIMAGIVITELNDLRMGKHAGETYEHECRSLR